jgi:hypothetical protein
MISITRTWSWSPEPFDPSLPPPLCWTVPAGSRQQSGTRLLTSPGLNVTLRARKLMMDPSDPSTWQKVYRFT